MTLRALYFDEDDAKQVAARLAAEGFAADVARDRLAGEDDDEDHPWAVSTDAPESVVEPLLDEYDGWLDAAAQQGGARPPLELPDGPRRVKGHFRQV